MNRYCFNIFIEGVVQGVGFRPFVYNLAKSKGYKGSIKNTSSGVMIEIKCDDPEYFLSLIKKNCPPLAQIYSIDIKESPTNNFRDFTILDSFDSEGFTHLPPDISVCEDCINELCDPSDRRFLYPFINCINCGPRYSITRQIPYDRPNTTMSDFQMCSECEREYNDPSNRRFHAQPNACHECGPRLSLFFENSEFKGTNEEKLKMTITLLKQGAIVALKGIGGFHLACDAENDDAIMKLRERKKRINKPFAIMSPDIETVKNFCEVSQAEFKLLNDKRRPVVLLKKKAQYNLSAHIAPNNGCLGFMLPYTPLHYLLFAYPGLPKADIAAKSFSALIMTSGNISEEPIIVDNDKAIALLYGVADAFLVHDREIFMRVDDSVLKIYNSKPVFIRRSRGYAPDSVRLDDGAFDILATGADIKSTFTIIKGEQAVISQHIGDLENVETLEFFQETFDNLKCVYRASPAAVAYDIHPGYHSSNWALKYAEMNGIKSYGIQHHYAHIASVMAERGLKDRIIGIAFDGTGYGTDGNLWGGEFLICDINGFERVGHFKYIPLPGGEMSIRECWRTAVSYLRNAINKVYPGSFDNERLFAILDSIGFIKRFGTVRIENILKIIGDGKFSPLSSSAGRLFDAVSAIIGVCDANTFEGESAAALEGILDEKQLEMQGLYPYEIREGSPCIIDFSDMFMCIVEDIKHNQDKKDISMKFHNTLVEVVKDMANIIRHKTGINTVALSGGVFQNKYIVENVYKILEKRGFEIYFNEKAPCNDGGLSLGQAYILSERLKNHRLC